MDDARLFLCARCQRQVLICSRCDRGQQYCAMGCAGLARGESLRAAGHRYQQTRRGQHCHAERQRRYRTRCREGASAEIVTHHGSALARCGTKTPNSRCTDGVVELRFLPVMLRHYNGLGSPSREDGETSDNTDVDPVSLNYCIRGREHIFCFETFIWS